MRVDRKGSETRARSLRRSNLRCASDSAYAGVVDRAITQTTAAAQIGPELLLRWTSAAERFEGVLAEIGIDGEPAATSELSMAAVPVAEYQSFFSAPTRVGLEPDEQWMLFNGGIGGSKEGVGLALPMRHFRAFRGSAAVAIYIEVHSRMVSWYLTYVWRAKELDQATRSLIEANQVVAAACCARALLETTAQFWADAERFRDAWDTAKSSGPPEPEAAFQSREPLANLLNEVHYGAKFDEKAPDAQEAFGRTKRANALSSVKRFADRTPGDIQTDYQWLCNVVHPSIGAALVYSTYPHVHNSGTHSIRLFSNGPVQSGTTPTNPEDIARILARTSTVALEALVPTAAQILRVIDDIGLTTEVPKHATFDYWRAVTRPGPNAPCPCRSGLKSKRCRHEWGDSAPDVPRTFIVDDQ